MQAIFVYPLAACLRQVGLYTERQKSCTTFLIVVFFFFFFFFQTLMAFENKELSMNGQVISNIRSVIVQSVVLEFTKMSKTLILTQNVKSIGFP